MEAVGPGDRARHYEGRPRSQMREMFTSIEFDQDKNASSTIKYNYNTEYRNDVRKGRQGKENKEGGLLGLRRARRAVHEDPVVFRVRFRHKIHFLIVVLI